MGTDYRLILPATRVCYETYKGQGLAFTELGKTFGKMVRAPDIYCTSSEVLQFTRLPSPQYFIRECDIELDATAADFAVAAIGKAMEDRDHAFVSENVEDVYKFCGFGKWMYIWATNHHEWREEFRPTEALWNLIGEIQSKQISRSNAVHRAIECFGQMPVNNVLHALPTKTAEEVKRVIRDPSFDGKVYHSSGFISIIASDVMDAVKAWREQNAA